MSPDAALPGGRSLAQAVVTALVLLGLIVVCYFLGTDAFFVLAAVVVLMALYELLDAIKRAGKRPVVTFGVACGLAMVLTAYFLRTAVLGGVIAITTLGAFLLALRPTRGEYPASDVAWTVLAVTWVGGGGAGAVSILDIVPGGLELLVGFVLTVAAGDIGAFFFGTSLGRHKMAPSISPNKSWEGFAGGLVAALAAGAFFGWWLDELTAMEALGIGAICGVFAPVGDLVESMAKREIGIKDSGRMLPGHGGMLDRLDAILFCAPLVYLYLRLVVL